MNSIDKFTLSLSILGIYGLVICLRYLIPCYAIPLLSARLSETHQLLDHAEEIDAIPPECEYRAHLDLYGDILYAHRSSSHTPMQFAAMRVESNNARWPFQQLRLAIRRGLTCRLYVLYYRIEGIKLKLELVIDKQQLRIAESANKTAVVSPTTATATPANDVVDPTLPLPATSP